LYLSGTIFVTAHNCGALRIIDVFNDTAIKLHQHVNRIKDFCLIDLCNYAKYTLHHLDNVTYRHPSYSLHHMIASISDDQTLALSSFATYEGEDRVSYHFRPNDQLGIIRSSGLFIAVSIINKRRVALLKMHTLVAFNHPISQLLPISFLGNIYLSIRSKTDYHWLGDFSLNGQLLEVYFHQCDNSWIEADRVEFGEVHAIHMDGHPFSEYRILRKSNKHAYPLFSDERIQRYFTSDQNILFVLSNRSSVYYTDSLNSFKNCPIHQWLKTDECITSFSTFGPLIAFGTNKSNVFLFYFSSFENLHNLQNLKLLFNEKISDVDEDVVSVAIHGYDFGVILGLSSKDRILSYKFIEN
jgi:hypothetical protein